MPLSNESSIAGAGADGGLYGLVRIPRPYEVGEFRVKYGTESTHRIQRWVDSGSDTGTKSTHLATGLARRVCSASMKDRVGATPRTSGACSLA